MKIHLRNGFAYVYNGKVIYELPYIKRENEPHSAVRFDRSRPPSLWKWDGKKWTQRAEITLSPGLEIIDDEDDD